MFSNLTSIGNVILTGIMPQIAVRLHPASTCLLLLIESFILRLCSGQGIYPTILIVLVNFGKTHFETDFAHGGSTGLDTFVAVRRETAFISEGGVSQVVHVDLEHGNQYGSGGGQVSSERKNKSSVIGGASGLQDISEKEGVSIVQ